MPYQISVQYGTLDDFHSFYPPTVCLFSPKFRENRCRHGGERVFGENKQESRAVVRNPHEPQHFFRLKVRQQRLLQV